jgi:hypothetical protein
MTGPPPIELLVFTGEPIGKAYITLARLEGGRWQSRQLFTVTDFYNRDVQMSPDRRYLYVLSECTWLGDIVRGELTALSNYQQYYQCLFSPNGRHLFGHQLRIPVGEAGDFVLFSLPDNRPVVLAKGRAMNFGWYPDSRHVWYEQDQPEQGRSKGVKPSRFFYQIDTYTGKQKKLSAQEVRRLNTDWYLLNRRFRVGGVGSTNRSFPGYRYIDRVIVVETATGRQFTAFELDGHRVGDFYVMHTMGRGFLFGVCQFA